MITRARFREAVMVGTKSFLQVDASTKRPIRATTIGVVIGTETLVPWANVRDVDGDFSRLASVGERKP